MRKKLTACGFSLIEILVVLAIAGGLIAIALPSLNSATSQTGAQDAAVTYAQTLRQAKTLAEAGQGDSPWGVRIATSSVILFKGSSFAARDVTYDNQYAATIAFTVSGLSEVDFAKFTGLPNTTGTTTIIDLTSTTRKNVYINAKGFVIY